MLGRDQTGEVTAPEGNGALPEQQHLKISVGGTAAVQLGLGETAKALVCVLKEQLYQRRGKAT